MGGRVADLVGNGAVSREDQVGRWHHATVNGTALTCLQICGCMEPLINRHWERSPSASELR